MNEEEDNVIASNAEVDLWERVVLAELGAYANRQLASAIKTADEVIVARRKAFPMQRGSEIARERDIDRIKMLESRLLESKVR